MFFNKQIFISTALIFFLIYDFGLLILPSLTTGRLIFIMLCLFQIITQKTFVVNKKLYVFLSVLLLIFLASLIQFMNSMESTQNSRLFWFTIYSIITPFFLMNIFKTRTDFLYAFFLATIIQSIVTIYSFFNPEFKQFILSTIVVGGHDDIKEGFRAIGFTSSSGAAFSMIQFCGVFSGLLLLKYNKKSVFESIFIVLSIVVVLLSTLIIGRTGLICSLVSIIYFLILNLNFKKIFFYLVITFLIGQINFIGILERQTESIEGFKIEFFKNWIEDGFQFENNSTSRAIQQMPIPPLTINTILGTGQVLNAARNGNASGHDSGYIQTYYSLGIVLTLIFYISFFIFLINITKMKNVNFILFFIFILFLAENKEPFIFKYIMPFYLLTLILFCNKERIALYKINKI
jgi:hypothetical protein